MIDKNKIKNKCIDCLGKGEIKTHDENKVLIMIRNCGRCGGTGDELLALVKQKGDSWEPID